MEADLLIEWKQFAVDAYHKSIEDQAKEKKEILFQRGRSLIKQLKANLGVDIPETSIDELGYVHLDEETFRLSGYDDIEILYSCPECKKTLFVSVNTAKDIGAIFDGIIPPHSCGEAAEAKTEMSPERLLVDALKAVLK
jgi:hypothetical protein